MTKMFNRGCLAALTVPALALAVPATAAVPGDLAMTSAPDAVWQVDGADHGRKHRRGYDRNGYEQSRYYGRDYRQAGYDGSVWRGDDGRYYCRRSNGTTGLLIGGAGGALLGREIAGRGDRTMGAILGAAGGALLGRAIDRGRSTCR